MNKRVRALEQARPDYPEDVVQEALRRIETEKLRGYVAVLCRVVDEGFPEKEAEPAVKHIFKVCEEIEKERRREY